MLAYLSSGAEDEKNSGKNSKYRNTWYTSVFFYSRDNTSVYQTYFISSLSIIATKYKFSEFDRNWLNLQKNVDCLLYIAKLPHLMNFYCLDLVDISMAERLK